jgi:hypothetical protein
VSVHVVVGWVGVAVEEFFGVVGVVDVGWCGAVGPGQAAVVGEAGVVVAVGDAFVVGAAGEEQFVGVAGAVGCPVRAVVDLAVVAGLEAVRAGAAAVAGRTV